MRHTFIGCDTGLFGAFAGIDVVGEQVKAVRLVAIPTRGRDEGGKEVATAGAVDALLFVAPLGWTLAMLERPVRGGMGAQQRGVEFAQGDAHGVARAVLELESARGRGPMPSQAFVSGGLSWHAALGMQSAKKAGVDRKTLSIQVAEGLLSHLINRDHPEVSGLAPCRGYTGIIGGQAQARSGAADAFLLAWHAYRRWHGVRDGAVITVPC